MGRTEVEPGWAEDRRGPSGGGDAGGSAREVVEPYQKARASVARPLIEGLKNPTVAREERLRRLLPFELTPFDEAAKQAFTR